MEIRKDVINFKCYKSTYFSCLTTVKIKVLLKFANLEKRSIIMEMKIATLAQPFEFKASEDPVLQIILIHGFTASPSEIKPLGEYLFDKSEKKYMVRSILLPGHGIDGEEGYKALDSVSNIDWKNYCLTKVLEFSEEYVCPIVLIGLSMGALLVIHLLVNSSVREKCLGGVLLSPALYMQSKFLPIIKYLKYFIKYQPKGLESEQFYKEHNLFSYTIRSIHGVDELRKLAKSTRPLVKEINNPLLTFLSQNDDVVDVKKTSNHMANIASNFTYENSSLGHILTVFPESKTIFDEIHLWIEKLLKKG